MKTLIIILVIISGYILNREWKFKKLMKKIKITFTMIYYHVHMVTRSFIEEKLYEFLPQDRTDLKKLIMERFKECDIDKYVKDLFIRFDVDNVISITIAFQNNEIEEELVFQFDINKLQEEHIYANADFPIIFKEDGKTRFTGELVCNIRFGAADDFSSIERHDNKFDSNNFNVKIYFEGEMKNNLPHGFGRLFWEDGLILYEGNFNDGQITGYGKTYFLSGGISEDGNRINGVLDGECTCYYENGQIMYKGNMKDGSQHGYGILYFEDGSLQYEGYLDEGYAIDGLIYRSINGMLYKIKDNEAHIVNKDGKVIGKISKDELNKMVKC